jgi:hypothetical protein
VARHVETILAVLEGHHTSEHELLWPRLLERVPEELAPVVHLMESQHEQIHEHLEQTLALLPRWRAGATPADRDRLGTAVEALVEALTEHMAAEERHLCRWRRARSPRRSGPSSASAGCARPHRPPPFGGCEQSGSGRTHRDPWKHPSGQSR